MGARDGGAGSHPRWPQRRCLGAAGAQGAAVGHVGGPEHPGVGGGDVGGGGEGSGVGRLWREGRRDGGASVRRRRTAPRSPAGRRLARRRPDHRNGATASAGLIRRNPMKPTRTNLRTSSSRSRGLIRRTPKCWCGPAGLPAGAYSAGRAGVSGGGRGLASDGSDGQYIHFKTAICILR